MLGSSSQNISSCFLLNLRFAVMSELNLLRTLSAIGQRINKPACNLLVGQFSNNKKLSKSDCLSGGCPVFSTMLCLEDDSP